jgi:hypothetical protein
MKDKLNVYSKNITSQHGEDGILEYIIVSLDGKINNICCEFGAWDGIFASNTYNLWKNKNWHAILIEGDKDKYDDLHSNTINLDHVNSIHSFVQPKGKDCLDEIFKNKNLPKHIGLLSVDIDSFDYHVWKNLKYVDPQIIVIEHNLFIPGYMEYYDLEGHPYLRCSAKSLEILGKEMGYKLICCTLSNSIFIKNSLFDKDKFPDYPVEYLFDYSSIQSQILMTGTSDNRYPINSKKISNFRFFLYKFYYRMQSLVKSNVSFIPPSKKVKENFKKFDFFG